jgi:hypothetical protein
MATPTTLPNSFTTGQILTAAQMNNLRGAFRVLQVVTAQKTDTFTTASSTMVDVTGVSLSITPSSVDSKILVGVFGQCGQSSATNVVRLNLVRGSTAIAQSTGGGSANQTMAFYHAAATIGMPFAMQFLDSPATTSATTYKLQAASPDAVNIYIGRFSINGNFPTVTNIVAMEISA